MGLLEDQDYYCYYPCLIFPSFTPSRHPSHFICLSLFFPSLIRLTSFSPTFPPFHRLPPFFPLYSGPQSEDRLLAGGCCRGGRASKSLMRCLSPPSRLGSSSQQRITTTTTLHCTTHTVPCLPTAAAAAEGIARGKVCVCVWRVVCLKGVCLGGV